MSQYDKRFRLSVNVVYKLKIVDKDSQDLRTASRRRQKVVTKCQTAFPQLQMVKIHAVLDCSKTNVACSDPVWGITTRPPALISLCDILCTERLLRWSVADLSPRRPRCWPQASSSGIWGGQCVNGAGLSPCTSALPWLHHPTTTPYTIVPRMLHNLRE